MKLERIGLMSPGDMGQAVALQLKARGFEVCTALEGRSARSRALAREAGLVDLGTVRRLLAECDAVLSIMNPGAALEFARAAARALREAPARTLVVDCNAVAPATAAEIAALVGEAGGRFLDAAIIGPPPRGQARTRLYVSGPGAADLEPLAGPQLAVTVLSERVGDASALKMCSAALTKGTQALWLEVLCAARALGVDEALERELGGARAPIRDWVLAELPLLPPKAARWVPEMLEIAKTLGATGSTPRLFEALAEICSRVAAHELAREPPEHARARGRDGSEIVRRLARGRAPAR